jgi:predicted permease
MLEILFTVLPVFAVLAAGYVTVRSGYLPVTVADALNAFTVRLAVPVLLMRAMYRLDLSAAFYPPMLISFYAGAILCFVTAILLARMLWKRRPGEAVAVGFSATFSNTVLLGLPIVERAFGHEALTPAYGIVALHAPTLYAIGMLTMEVARRDGRPISEAIVTALRSIVANPLMIGILTGAALNLTDIELGEPLLAAVNLISEAAIPAALVGIGASLTQYRLRAEWGEAAMVSAITLMLHPAIALAVAYFAFALPPEQMRTAVLLAAMPPGMNIYVFAVMYQRAQALAASAILMATAASVVTISLWLAVLRIVAP